MPLNSKVIIFDTETDVLSSSNIYWQKAPRTLLTTGFSCHESNPDWTGSGYTDSPMTGNTMQVHDDLLFVCGWGDGFSVYRISDAGALTNIYYQIDPFTPSNSDSYMASLALDKVNKKCYVGGPRYDFIGVFDYSGAHPTGSTVTQDVLTEGADGLPSDEVGYTYYNGLAIAGDYLYIVPDDKTVTSAQRWHTGTGVASTISITNYRNGGIYGRCSYDEDNDRIYMQWRDNGEIWVIENASTAGATGYCVRVSDASGGGVHMRTQGCITDKSNPNYAWMGCVYRWNKYDISACPSSGSPSLINTSRYLYASPYFLTDAEGICFCAPDPVWKSDFIMYLADRGNSQAGGWWDQENDLPVGGSYRYSGVTDAIYSSTTPLYYDYQAQPVKMTSSGGNSFWVWSGYGGSGHGFHVYNAATKTVGLATAANIDIGTFSLNGNVRIGYCYILGLENQTYTLSDTTLNFYVSNDNGSTWESYSPGEYHEFASNGYQFRFRASFTGEATKSAHVQGLDNLGVVLYDASAGTSWRKVTAARLQGAS